MSEAHIKPKTLAELLADMWQARTFIAFGLCIAVFVGVAVQTTAVRHYKSIMIVAPASTMNGAEASSLLADDDLFALRYIMQRVGVGNSSDFMRFENTYDGATVAQALLDDPKIMSGLQIDQGFTFSETKTRWSAAELADYINKRVILEPVGATALRRMVYYHANPDFAQYFLHKLHKTTDTIIRTKIRTESIERIDYLEKTIRETKNPEHKRALTTLLMEQERLKMLVSLDIPYAASVIEAPSSSFKALWPPMALVWAALLTIGALFGFVLYQARGETAQKQAHTPEKTVQKKHWYKPTARNQNAVYPSEKSNDLKSDEQKSA